MRGKFDYLLDTTFRDGSIINANIIDQKKKFYEHPNKACEVTDCPERAYYSKDMLALRPLSETDETYERINPKRQEIINDEVKKETLQYVELKRKVEFEK